MIGILRTRAAWIALPPVLTLLLFAVMSFGVFLPMFEDRMLSQKKLALRHLTEAAWSVLDHYGDLAASGSLPRAEAQRRAAEDLRQMRYGPRGVGYYWISDTQARMVMHPHQPDLEGRNLSEYRDANGKRLFAAFADAVRASPGGYVHYVWPTADDRTHAEPKLSYVRKYDPWGWIVGTGVYLDDVAHGIADMRRSLIVAACFLLIGVLLLLLLSGLHVGWTEGQRRRAQAELEVVSKALHAAANAIVITDAQARIKWINPAFRNLTGYTEADVIGRNPRLLKSGAHTREFYREMWSTIRRGDVWQGEITNRRKDGTFYTEEMTLTPVNNAEGRVTHFIAVKQDVTDKRNAREELRAAKEAADAANQAKSDFLAKMSHELRTPLNAIIGFTELMIDDSRDPPTEKRATRLEKVHRNAKALLHLISDIIDLSKVEADRFELTREPFDVVATLAECADSAQALIKSPDVTLAFDLHPSLAACRVWIGDAARLRQIVLNLLSNALKFTEAGRVALRAERDPEWLTIVVEDTGIGIATEHLPTIFGEFQQVDSSSTRRAGGAGLGLAICQRLCRLMGGAISAQSTLEEGSVFTIRLPAGGATAQVPATIEEPVSI